MEPEYEYEDEDGAPIEDVVGEVIDKVAELDAALCLASERIDWLERQVGTVDEYDWHEYTREGEAWFTDDGDPIHPEDLVWEDGVAYYLEDEEEDDDEECEPDSDPPYSTYPVPVWAFEDD